MAAAAGECKASGTGHWHAKRSAPSSADIKLRVSIGLVIHRRPATPDFPRSATTTRMLAGIRNFFDTLIAPAAGAADDAHALQLATAALLVETMRMDDRYDDAERAAVARALREHFGLDDAAVGALVDLAEREVREATDYYQFTSLINQRFDGDQKARIVEYMWRVALADGHLDAHEQHLLSKLADLLHVPHSRYIAAKLRAREAIAEAARDPARAPSREG